MSADPRLRDLPSKLYFRIGEVAGLVGVEPHVLRYWEREFRSIRPTKSAKGQRVYSRKDVENLLRVRDLLYRDGFTIAGAKKKLQRGAVEILNDGEAASATALEADGAAHAIDVRSVEAETATHVEEHAARSCEVAVHTVSHVLPAPTREALEDLRAEVVAFLDELSSVDG